MVSVNGKEEMTSARREVMVKVMELQDAPHNPPARIIDRNIATLAESMQEYGQKMPILITKSKRIIEGHRRKYAAIKLGWKYVRCIIDDKEEDADAIYATVNDNMAKMTSNDHLGIWLRNPAAVTRRRQHLLEDAQRMVGRQLMVQLYENGYGHSAIKTGKQILSLIGKDNNENLKRLLKWGIKYMALWSVYRMARLGEDPRVIWRAIEDDKDISLTMKIKESS